jgi:hypothetical protein
VLEGLRKNKTGTLTIVNDYGRQVFMKERMVRALLDLNIIFKSKYLDEIHVEHFLYLEVIDKYVSEKLKAMNGYEALRYKLYKKVKGIKFGTLYSGIPQVYANKK